MRQAGVLAAAGLYALEHHVQRLAEDHANAEYLAAGLRALGLEVAPPQTNVVYVDIPPAAHRVGSTAHCARRGMLASVAPRTRLVTHLDVPRREDRGRAEAFRDYPDWAP